MNQDEKISYEALLPIIAEQLEQNGVIRFKPCGISMLPFIRSAKDEVCIESLHRDLKKYDIIFYRRESGQFVLHRVIKISGENLYLRGDNQRRIEEDIKKTQIIGVLSEVKRGKKIIKEGTVSFYMWAVIGSFYSRTLLRLNRIYNGVRRRLKCLLKKK